MKIMKRIISWMGAKGLRHLPIVGVALFASAGCSQDPLLPGVVGDGRVQFVPTTGGSWTATRAAAPADTVLRCAVYPLEGTSQGDTLYLHATVSEREETAATAGTNGTTGTAETAGTAATRGTCVDNTTFHSSIGVYAFAYAGTWDDSRVADYMSNVEVTQASGWTTSYFWPGDRFTMRFFAYAPYGCGGLTPPAAGAQGTPQLRYRVAEQVADQQDLLAAWTGEVSGAGTATQPLAFRHALTAVRFATGNQILAGRISKITLRGVYASGRYTPNENGTGTWDNLGDVSDFSVAVSVPVGGTPDQPVTAPAETFLMIPQTLPQGAAVEIEYTDNISQQTRTLTAQIGGEVWPEGKSVTFRISTSNIIMTPTLTVTPPANYTYAGGDGTYQVTSYVTLTLPGGVQVKQPAAWTAEFYAYDDATGSFESDPLPQRPSWITAFTESGAGGVTAQSYQASVAMQVGITQNKHNDILQQAAPVSGTYDLSTQGGTTAMNTANCYVINAPGEYSLPLVYGNAIKNGATNSNAYTSSATGTNVLQHFINHTGNAITDPYIYNNAGCVPDNAVLVWQDEKDLVTNVALTADKQHLTFEVPQATIQQGNAIVAVRDAANQIMWSWHIWVTDFVPGLPATVETSYNPNNTQRDKVVTNYQGVFYTIMGVNLGWCDGEIRTYNSRALKIRFIQRQTGFSQDITLTQNPYYISLGGYNAPYYQWGRKDPMLPSSGSGNVNKTWYNADGISSTILKTVNWSNDISTIINGIQNPDMFCINTHMDDMYNNLWSADNTVTTTNDNLVIKTVYDPSPVGYCLPASNAFTGFTYNGSNISGSYYGSQYNSPYSSGTDFITNGGWTFYCNKMKSSGKFDAAGGIIFYPALGSRNYSLGLLNNVGTGGNSQVAVPNSTGDGRRLYFLQTHVYPVYYDFRAYGFSIRPAREK